MGFSFKGLFCGSEPNKMKLKNEINQRFSNEIESNVSTLAKNINKSIKKMVDDKMEANISNTSNVGSNSQVLIIENSKFKGATIDANFNLVSTAKQNSFNTTMTQIFTDSKIQDDIKNEIKTNIKADTDFKALLASMNSANNNQSELTQGEMNNMINKLTGLFDYSSTNTNITNVVDTELKNIITNRISNENIIDNMIDTLFKSNNEITNNNTCKSTNINSQMAKLLGVDAEDTKITVNFNMLVDTVITCTTENFISNTTLRTAIAKVDNKQDTSAESKISVDVTMKMTNSATNISEEKTTSFVNSFFDMVMYIGIAGIVLLTVVAIVFLLRKGPKPHTGSNNSLLNKIELPFTSTAQVKAPSVPIKPPVAPVKAPMPTKRIPGLPKF